MPIAGNAQIGRQKLGRGRHPVGPPVLGRTFRVLVLETGLLGLALDGKKLWERRGIPSGGMSMTSDDQLLVADEGKIFALDRKGKQSDVWSTNDVFVAPPVLSAEGLLFVAGGETLYALSFSS